MKNILSRVPLLSAFLLGASISWLVSHFPPIEPVEDQDVKIRPIRWSADYWTSDWITNASGYLGRLTGIKRDHTYDILFILPKIPTNQATNNYMQRHEVQYDSNGHGRTKPLFLDGDDFKQLNSKPIVRLLDLGSGLFDSRTPQTDDIEMILKIEKSLK